MTSICGQRIIGVCVGGEAYVGTSHVLKELSHPSIIHRAYKLVDRFTRLEGDYRW